MDARRCLDERRSQARFPLPYSLGAGLGTTPRQRWRVYAWLDAGDGQGAPASGAPYGVAALTLRGCGAYRDYCGTSEGVDIVLDRRAP